MLSSWPSSWNQGNWQAVHRSLRTCFVALFLSAVVFLVGGWREAEGAPLPAGAPVFYTITITATYPVTYGWPCTDPNLGKTVMAEVMEPAGFYTGTLTPLLIVIGGWGDTYHTAIMDWQDLADSRGWLLASAQIRNEECPLWIDPQIPPPPPLGARAAQHDIIDLLNELQRRYNNIDPDRIYLAGISAGGLQALVTAAKYPDVFAAVAADKAPTNLATWYYESESSETEYWRPAHIKKECDDGTPASKPFEYERRSPIRYAANLAQIPVFLSRNNSPEEKTVYPSHSLKLYLMVGAYPGADVTLYSYTAPGGHLASPPFDVIGDWLASKTRRPQPHRIEVLTDESKTFWWLGLAQLYPYHWSQVRAEQREDGLIQLRSEDDYTPGQPSLGISIALSALGLPGGAYTMDDVYLDAQPTGRTSRSVPSSGGWLSFTLTSGEHLIWLTPPGTTPLPSEVMTFQANQTGGIEDTYLSTYKPSDSFATSSNVKVGTGGPSIPVVYNGLFRFPLTGIPANAYVLGAYLSLYPYTVTKTIQPMVISAYPLSRDWTAAQATWYNARNGSPWAGPGAEVVPDDREANAQDVQLAGKPLRRYAWDVTEVVRRWLTGAKANQGLLLRGLPMPVNDGESWNEFFFASSDYGDVGRRPKLVVVYSPVTPTPTPTPTNTPTATPTATPTPTTTPTATATPNLGSIYGVAYEDVDGDDERDPGEPGLAGATIELVQGTATLTYTVTGGDGLYVFRVSPNLYKVRFSPPAGFNANTTDINVLVMAGMSLEVDFGAVRQTPTPTATPLPVIGRRGYIPIVVKEVP